MKSSAPWSVKGIERDARETAKEAARREGMTVGEWLNQIIYSAGETAPFEGDVEGVKLSDVVTAIDHLNKKIADANAERDTAVRDLSRKTGEAVDRLQQLERVKNAGGAASGVIERIEKLEDRGADKERIEALRALEKAVTQVAGQFNDAQKASGERLESTERHVQELAARVDKVSAHPQPAADDSALGGPVQESLEALTERVAAIEFKAQDAAAESGLDAEQLEGTSNRLRVLGDEIKRSGDQIRTLETNISKLADDIEAAERRSAEGVQKVAETISELREKFEEHGEIASSRAEIDAAVADANRETDARIQSLQTSFDAMITRLDAFGTDTDSVAAGIAQVAPDDLEQANATERFVDRETIVDAASRVTGTFEEKAGDASSDDDGDDAGEDGSPLEEISGGDDAGLSKQSEDPEIGTSHSGEIDDDPFAFNLDEDSQIDDAIESDADADSSAALARRQDDFDANDSVADDSGTDNSEIAEDERSQSAADAATADDASSPVTARAGLADGPTRRRLTAKQRAILAARARQKRLAAMRQAAEHATDEPTETADQQTTTSEADDETQSHAGADAPADTQDGWSAAADGSGVKGSLFDAEESEPDKPGETGVAGDESAVIGDDDADDEKTSRLQRLRNAAASMRQKMRGSDDDDEFDPHDGFGATRDYSETPQNESSAAFSTLKTTALARPVTLALAVAIILAGAALYFLMKDLSVNSSNLDTQPPVASVGLPAATQTVTDDGSAVGEDAVADAVEQMDAIDPRTLYLDGVAALNAATGQNDSDAAIDMLRQAATLGHPPSQLQIGELYKTGQGVEQDLAEARTWFRRAANGGNVLAMHRIGVMTARGEGGPADTTEAIGWFELAADRGLVDSQYNLGAIFHPSDDGSQSTIRDASKAYYWYSLASKNGDQQAADLAGAVASALTTAEKQAIDASVAQWEVLEANPEANELASSNS
ncbi:MAG: hypothetical protein AAGC77_06325 [Pseudomonadota bacterium]